MNHLNADAARMAAILEDRLSEWRVPMQRQPDEVVGGIPYRWEFGQATSPPEYVLMQCPFKRGDLIAVRDSRYTAEVLSVRAERVNEIDDEGIVAEVYPEKTGQCCGEPGCPYERVTDADLVLAGLSPSDNLVDWFVELWNRRHPSDPFDTAWCWVLGVKMHNTNIEAVKAGKEGAGHG